jgi:translation initiation factor IF-2
MSNDKDKDNKLSGAGRKTLQLKPASAAPAAGAGGVVVQRKKKLIMPGQAAPAAQKATAQKAPLQRSQPLQRSHKPKRKQAAPKADGRMLTATEREVRMRVLEQAKKDEAENAKKRAILEAAREESDKENAKARMSDEARQKEDQEKLTENLALKNAAEKKAAEAVAKDEKAAAAKKAAAAPAPKAAPKPARKEERKAVGPRLAGTTLKNRNDEPKKAVKGEEHRRGGTRLTVQQALAGNRERQRSMAALRRKRAKDKRKHGLVAPAAKVFREVVVPDEISVAELANRMTEKVNDVVRSLMKMGVMSSGSEMIDHDTAELIVEEFGHKPVRRSETDVEQPLYIEADAEDTLEHRAPVVTIMGHVDHGKTSILD